MHRSVFLIAQLLGALTALQAQLVVSDTAPSRSVTAIGRGEAVVSANRGVLVFAVIARGTQPQDVARAHTRRLDSLIAALRQAGVSEGRIQAGSFSLMNAQWHAQRIDSVGYEARSTLRVSVGDARTQRGIAEIARIAGTALASAGAQLLAVEPVAADLEAARAAALDAAILQSCRAASRIARGGNRALGSLVGAIVSDDQVPRGGVVYDARPAQLADLVVRAVVTARWELTLADSIGTPCRGVP